MHRLCCYHRSFGSSYFSTSVQDQFANQQKISTSSKTSCQDPNMVAAAKDPKVTVAASSDSPRNVPVVDSCTGTTEDASASGLQLTTPKPPGRRPFLEQFNLTPNRYEQVAKVYEIEKRLQTSNPYQGAQGCQGSRRESGGSP